MLLKLSQAGDPVLGQKARKLTASQLRSPQTQRLIDLMIATLRDYPGVGLAAPQVGESIQLVIIEDQEKYHKNIPARLLQAQERYPIKLTILVNPILEVTDETPQYFFEGCLSAEGYRAIVPRYSSVRVRAKDRHGNPITIGASG